MYAPEGTVIPCSTDPDLWMSGVKSKQQAAKDLCVTCVIRELCLEQAMCYAEAAGEHLQGIVAGLTVEERQRLEQSQV